MGTMKNGCIVAVLMIVSLPAYGWVDSYKVTPGSLEDVPIGFQLKEYEHHEQSDIVIAGIWWGLGYKKIVNELYSKDYTCFVDYAYKLNRSATKYNVNLSFNCRLDNKEISIDGYRIGFNCQATGYCGLTTKQISEIIAYSKGLEMDYVNGRYCGEGERGVYICVIDDDIVLWKWKYQNPRYAIDPAEKR